MTGSLRLEATAPSPVPLDDVLIMVVTLRNTGPEPVLAASGLSLAADLVVTVDGPDGEIRADWPWPGDLDPPPVELAAGAALAAGVMLGWSARPLFSRPARYGITCSFRSGRADEVTADRIVVERSAPADPEMAAALADADVGQSLAAGGVLGAAEPALRELVARGGPHARLLAALALGDLPELPAAAAGLAGAHGPLQVAAAASAALPGGGDGRRAALGTAVDGHEAALAVLAGVPYG